jgi:NADPH-dependent 2,4-dienoyl-CoA reductase/sulfur reductase-like enzyme/rhodanese-related sulfurtransferase
MRIVIVGGVAGGASAATRARRLSEGAEIVLIERGIDVSFANCGMPYYIGEKITSRDRLLVARPEFLRRRFAIDVRTRSEVESIDRVAKTVRVHDLLIDRTYDQPYDALILATGAAPLKPPIPGIDLPGIYTLRTLEDSDKIKAIVDRGIQRAVIVGAGFIGLEMAENLIRRGVQTTLVELQNQVLPPLDPEMAAPVSLELIRNRVQLRLGQSATAFEATESGLTVCLSSGEKVDAELVILGIGVRPESSLALQAGLEIGSRGGIQVSDTMQTSDPSIYAVGDVIEVQGFVTKAPTQVPLAGPANRQGRIAADNILGRKRHYRGTQATAIVGLFDLVAASTGETEKSLKRSHIAYEKIYVHPNQHAGYYPGAKPLMIKLLFTPTEGKVLGAQIVGSDGVDKKIDVFATAIQAGMTVFDLEEAELAYAPQFGSAKDAINMAGFVGAAIAENEYPQVYVETIIDTEYDGILIDVRTAEEFAAGSIPNALNIPLDELRDRMAELSTDKPMTVFCQAGQRGYIATRMLRQKGFDVSNLAGGYRLYEFYQSHIAIASGYGPTVPAQAV